MFTKKLFTGKSFWALVAGMAILLAACQPLLGSGAVAVPSNRSITVVGEGEAFGPPDQAVVEVGVETFAPEVNQAMRENEATVQAILDALAAEGIPDEDIQTRNYSLWTEQIYGDRGPEGIAGYRVTNLVQVTIRDIEQVGDVLGAVTDAGANTIYGVNFMVADADALADEARAAAMEDARNRAEELARLGEVELGEVLVISEVIGQPIEFGRGGGVAIEQAAFDPSISPGQLSYQMRLQVTYELR